MLTLPPSTRQDLATVTGSTVGTRSLIGAGATLSHCTVGSNASVGIGAVRK